MKKITLFTILLMGLAYATETRVNVITQNSVRFGYANFLLDDEFLIQFYPSTALRFPAHFTIETPVIRNNVYGNYAYASAFGKYGEFGFGAYAGRDRISDEITGFEIVPVDLLGSFNLQNIALGLNIRLGTFSLDDKENPATTVNASAIGFNPSLSFYISERSGLNIGIPFQFVSGKNKTGNNVNVEYSSNNFGFLGRFYSMPFIVYALFATGSENRDNPATNQNPDLKSSRTVFGAGGGLNLPISEIGFGIVGLSAVSTSQTNRENNVETKTSNFSIGLLLGGEIKAIRDNIKLRSSFTYDFLFNRDAQGKSTEIGRLGNLTLGIGYEIGFIRLDAALSSDLLYNGPFFLTGNTSNFIQSFSILGKF
ncbi:MAG: hypothetical protein RMJ38_06700 [candidate division WOR-3 bacterium]|nr:hypothetical protein [candidate division WOR-3 bacterium]MDW8151111.1 hypothetical protein [candidate division WOR-3 bacterium]